MLKTRPFHPILFALFPVLSLYSHNTALVSVKDLPVPLLIVLGATGLFWGVLSLPLRSITRGAVGASVGVVAFFAYGHLWDLVQKQPSLKDTFPWRSDLLWYWTPASIALVVVACWKWKKPEVVTGAMNVGGLVLAGFPLLSILGSWFSAWKGTPVAELSTHSTAIHVNERPDIYYIVLDGYGRSDALKRVIGFSNDVFIKGLEDRGFYVAKESRANYCQTELSLSSSLNLDYLPKILPRMTQTWQDRRILDKLIDQNQVSKYLKKLGYRYEAITTGFPSVHPESADLWFQTTQGISFFAGVLLNEIPLSTESDTFYQSQFGMRRDMIRAAFTNLVNSANSVDTQPRFVLAHILAPHPPFVFDHDGRPVHTKSMGYALVDGSDFMDYGGTPAEYKNGYAEQAAYINKLVLNTVDQILKSSHKPPIILLQGDHGSKVGLNQQLLEKTDVNECFPNLNAYLVPSQVRSNLYPSITPVNSFRMIFNGLFGDNFKRLSDDSFYSGWLTPFTFTDVTKRVSPPLH